MSLREWDVNSKFDSENLRKFKEVEDRTKRNEDEIMRQIYARTKKVRCDVFVSFFNFIFSRDEATLYEGVSVGRSVRRSVRNQFF